MRKATAKPANEIRATFVAPRDLVEEFRALARRRERNLSQELRKLMADEVARDRERAAA